MKWFQFFHKFMISFAKFGRLHIFRVCVHVCVRVCECTLAVFWITNHQRMKNKGSINSLQIYFFTHFEWRRPKLLSKLAKYLRLLRSIHALCLPLAFWSCSFFQLARTHFRTHSLPLFLPLSLCLPQSNSIPFSHLLMSDRNTTDEQRKPIHINITFLMVVNEFVCFFSLNCSIIMHRAHIWFNWLFPPFC